jgi:hypothetical protein
MLQHEYMHDEVLSVPLVVSDVDRACFLNVVDC